MLGYEFEFLTENRKTHKPITNEELTSFHEALAGKGWENRRDPITKEIAQSTKDGTKVTTDASIFITEINLPPTETVKESDRDTKELLGKLDIALEPLGLEFLGIGMFPFTVPKNYDYMCNKAFVKYVLSRYFNMSIMHRIAACQYWFDVPKERLVEYINIMNRLSGICTALLGNSPFSNGKRNLDIAERALAWEEIAGRYPSDVRIVGVPDREYAGFLDYLEHCFKAPFYGGGRLSSPFYLEDHSRTNEDFFFSDEIEVIGIDGEMKVKPELGDLYDIIQKNMFFENRAKFRFKKTATVGEFKRAYLERDEAALIGLLDKAFIECRIIASQNRDEFSIGPAFILGLLENLDKTKELLGKGDYEYWKELRKKAIKDGLDFEIEGKHIADILDEFLQVSEEGLKKRGFGEEKFLVKAKELVSKRENPGQRKVRLFEEGGMERVIEDCLV